MAQIVCVHGIAQQFKGPETLLHEWRGALRDGMRIAGIATPDLPPDDSIDIAFFGELFRGDPHQHTPDKGNADQGHGDLPYQLSDIDQGFEADLLRAWAAAALIQDGDKGVVKAGWAPHSVQSVAKALLHIPYFAQITDRLLVGALKQLRMYFTQAPLRAQVKARLAALIQPDTRLVIAHSLGSIVAYEVLCQEGLPATPAFVTIGSPLGLRNLVFERLQPPPSNGTGCWPRHAASWTNIADGHDIVASEKNLAPLFGDRVEDVLVDNGSLAHDIGPYFTAAATGRAVFQALRGS